jgi:ankyrin repeat protein
MAFLVAGAPCLAAEEPTQTNAQAEAPVQADAPAEKTAPANALVLAVRAGDLKTYLAQIEAGAYADPVADKLVALAVKSGNVALVRRLIDAGADPDVAEEVGITPLMLAARTGNVAMAELLLEKGADPNRRDDAGATALYWAIKESHRNLVERLVARGADADNVITGHSAIAVAVGAEQAEIAELLRASCRSNCK